MLKSGVVPCGEGDKWTRPSVREGSFHLSQRTFPILSASLNGHVKAPLAHILLSRNATFNKNHKFTNKNLQIYSNKSSSQIFKFSFRKTEIFKFSFIKSRDISTHKNLPFTIFPATSLLWWDVWLLRISLFGATLSGASPFGKLASQSE